MHVALDDVVFRDGEVVGSISGGNPGCCASTFIALLIHMSVFARRHIVMLHIKTLRRLFGHVTSVVGEKAAVTLGNSGLALLPILGWGHSVAL